MEKQIAIIDSGGANIQSVVFAFERLGLQPVFTRDRETIARASHVILPGVGAAKTAMNRLNEYGLAGLIPELTQPVLGICLGLQLLFRKSAEGDAKCLGIIPADVEALPACDRLTLPHTGWNRIEWTKQGAESSLANGVPFGSFAYFVHSYAAPVGPWTLATTLHGVPFSSIVRWKNFTGIQFHPERSSETGLRLLASFLEGPGSGETRQ